MSKKNMSKNKRQREEEKLNKLSKEQLIDRVINKKLRVKDLKDELYDLGYIDCRICKKWNRDYSNIDWDVCSKCEIDICDNCAKECPKCDDRILCEKCINRHQFKHIQFDIQLINSSDDTKQYTMIVEPNTRINSIISSLQENITEKIKNPTIYLTKNGKPLERNKKIRQYKINTLKSELYFK